MQLARINHGAVLPVRRQRLAGARVAPRGLRVLRAVEQKDTPPLMMSGEETDTGEDHLAADYCSLDASGKRVKKGNRSLGEMEQEFLDAMSSFYFDGKAAISDAEFDLLKEELLWAGSKVVVLDADEQRFLEAVRGWGTGHPIMSDEEFDQLRTDLRVKGSIVAAQGPRCSLRSKKMYADASPDYLRMTALNIPAALLVLGLVFSIDDLTGFEITSALELPPPYGIVALWGLVLPVLYLLSSSITNIVLRDGLILKGPCPCCGTNNYSYFGDIFIVPGSRGANTLECTNTACRADLTFDYNKRVVVVDRTPEDKAEELAAAAAKKAAAAAKKAAMAAKKAAAAAKTEA
ncbi:MAG: hypothetical protein J3K34DRAFT_388819 [Monoraphidium minutum]|nr:MAG: hypothetical protein J3K34DRAFT_388819 [Monoraphidium minutum]